MIAYCVYTWAKMILNEGSTILGCVGLVLKNWVGCGYT